MQLNSVRIIANNMQQMVQFYEQVTAIKATWYTPDFAEIHTPMATLAIGSTKTLQLFGGKVYIQAAQNKTVIIEFSVMDVDQLFDKLSPLITSSLIQAPTTMPWGNRSLLFRDPEGNLLNLFTPLSREAKDRFNQKSQVQ